MNISETPSERHLADTAAWSARPWIWAAIGAVVMVATERILDANADAVVNQVAAVFLIVSGLAFGITAERLRINWAMGFALGSAAVLALVGWFTASYNKGGQIGEYPFFAGIFAVLVAAPLFQTVRDEGGWRFPYPRLHSHVWTDAVIGAASFAFVGISFGLAFLIAQLFDIIGIKFFTELFNKDWFSAGLGGAAFGGAFGLLRERDALVATLQKLVLLILSILAPVLALALVGFLVSLPFTGLSKLWDSGIPTTPTLLIAAGGAVGLINAVIGDAANDGSRSRVLRYSAIALSLCILPLAAIAALSMGVRIDQHGWTPSRIWGLIAIIFACVYGVTYLVAVARAVRGKQWLNWDIYIRPANVKIAIGTCALAIALALPILDFGGISARDHVARLKSKIINANQFDWRAMAFDFGPKGRNALAALKDGGTSAQRKSASFALQAKNRWDVDAAMEGKSVDYSANFQVQGAGPQPDDILKSLLIREGMCRKPCRILWMDANRVLVVSPSYETGPVGAEEFTYVSQAAFDANAAKIEKERTANDPEGRGIYAEPYNSPPGWARRYNAARERRSVDEISSASKLEIRDVTRQQMFVDGVPVGELFEK